MNVASILVLAAILVLSVWAIVHCRRHGAPCEGRCGGSCAACPLNCRGKAKKQKQAISPLSGENRQQ